MGDEDSKARGTKKKKKKRLLIRCLESLPMTMSSKSPRTPERQCSVWKHCRKLVLHSYGTVKAYHILEVVFNSKKDDCITRLCPLSYTQGSRIKCSPVSRPQFLRNRTKA